MLKENIELPINQEPIQFHSLTENLIFIAS